MHANIPGWRKGAKEDPFLVNVCDLVDSHGGRKGIVRALSLILEWRPSCSGVGDHYRG
jgi:hypothetical protein